MALVVGMEQYNRTISKGEAIFNALEGINKSLKKDMFNVSFYLPFVIGIYGIMCVYGGWTLVMPCVGGSLVGALLFYNEKRIHEREGAFREIEFVVGSNQGVDVMEPVVGINQYNDKVAKITSLLQSTYNSNLYLNRKRDNLMIYSPVIFMTGGFFVVGGMPIVTTTFICSLMGLCINYSKLVEKFC